MFICLGNICRSRTKKHRAKVVDVIISLSGTCRHHIQDDSDRIYRTTSDLRFAVRNVLSTQQGAGGPWFVGSKNMRGVMSRALHSLFPTTTRVNNRQR